MAADLSVDVCVARFREFTDAHVVAAVTRRHAAEGRAAAVRELVGLVGASEAAARLGVSRSRVYQLAGRRRSLGASE